MAVPPAGPRAVARTPLLEVESLAERTASRDRPAPLLPADLPAPLPTRERAGAKLARGVYVIAAVRLGELELVFADVVRDAPVLALPKDGRDTLALEPEENEDEEDLLPELEDGPARAAWAAVAINTAAATYRSRVISIGNEGTGRV